MPNDDNSHSLNKNKALFLDRDGVINYDYGYVYKKENFIFRSEIFDICKKALFYKFKIIVITNQSGIGQNLYTKKDFNLLNKFMIKKFLEKKIKITDVYYCPYHPFKGKGVYLKDSYNRKPNPGMLIQASKEHLINLNESIMIGDKETDYKAAINAKLKYYIDANQKDWDQRFFKLIYDLRKNKCDNEHKN